MVTNIMTKRLKLCSMSRLKKLKIEGTVWCKEGSQWEGVRRWIREGSWEINIKKMNYSHAVYMNYTHLT